ncbi:hypothetical protein ACFV20_35465 [Streptomyces sp. NPDC059696]|uniref:hypothetical protein n=1 Tax=Streptomyces sp. NPDC059696 TaxID=3346911 RepID=UPI0036C466A3
MTLIQGGRRALARASAVVAAAMCAVLLATTQASAGAADLNRTLTLTQYPEPGSRADMQRTIYLAAGNYSWDVNLGGPFAPADSGYVTRDIYLAAGTYTWYCAIYAPDYLVYVNTCYLEKPGSARAWIESRSYRLWTSGSYTLSSRLVQR